MKWMFWKDHTDKSQTDYKSYFDMYEDKQIAVVFNTGESHIRKIKWHPSLGSDGYYISASCVFLDNYKTIIPLTSVKEILIRDIGQ